MSVSNSVKHQLQDPGRSLIRPVPNFIDSFRLLSLLFLLILTGTLLLFRFTEPGALGPGFRCPVHQYTGRLCPGCGSMRALHSLVHGHFIPALRANFMMVLLLPGLLYSFAYGLLTGREPGSNPRLKARLSNMLIIVLLVFTIGRNLLGGV